MMDAVLAVQADEAPYPGLRAFLRDESHIFFGREKAVNDMVDRLGVTRFLAVTGASGSGKSSLVRTGLLDALDRGLLANAGSNWQVADFRPGTAPLSALTDALVGALGLDISGDGRALAEATIARGPLGLVEFLDRASVPPEGNLLLLVDQFEETFRYRQSDAADAFVALLLASAAQRRWPIYVVITMRSDFLGECARFADLAETINNAQFLTPRLTRAQLRRAIEGPAAVYGAAVEPALVTRLLNDMGSNPDQLPLMQHVLMLIWDQAQAKLQADGVTTLSLATYEALGGVGRALSDHLDRVVADLTPGQRRLAETAFRALVQSEGVAGRDVRRPVALGEIAEIAGVTVPEAAAVVEAFRGPGRYFLTPAGSLSASSVIDVSHESLIRQWSTLRGWVRAEFQSAQTWRHIAESARLKAAGQDDYLTNPFLGLAQEWRQRERPNATWAARYGGDYALGMRLLDESASRQSVKRWIGYAIVAALLVGSVDFARRQYLAAEATQLALDAKQVELEEAARETERALAAKQAELQQVQNSQRRLRLLRSNLKRVQTDMPDVSFADEQKDFGVAPQDALQVRVGTPTPLTIPGGKMLSTKGLAVVMFDDPPPILIDVWNNEKSDHRSSLPWAVRIPFGGNAGRFDDQVQARLATRLTNLTGSDRGRALVFFCVGPECWESYNAALRAIHAGFTNVFWYRGGFVAWAAAKNEFEEIVVAAEDIVARLRNEPEEPPQQRWALAVSLSEAVTIMSDLKISIETIRPFATLAVEELSRLREPLNDDRALLEDLAVSQRRLSIMLAGSDLGKGIEAYRAAVATRGDMLQLDLANRSLRRDYLIALRALAQFLEDQKRYADAAVAWHDAAKAWRWEVENTRSASDVAHDLGDFQRKAAGNELAAGNRQAALATYESALAVDLTRTNESAAREVAADHRGAAEALIADDRIEDGLDRYRAAAAVLHKAAERFDEDPTWQIELSLVHEIMAKLLRKRNELEPAAAHAHAAIAAARKARDFDPTKPSEEARKALADAAGTLGGIAWNLDLVGKFDAALAAATEARLAAPAMIWVEANRAHALMFLGRVGEARAIYRRYLGSKFGGRDWDSELRSDFVELSRAGLTHPLMDEILSAMAPTKP